MILLQIHFMFAPSLLTLPLIVLWITNTKIASYFYPFIYVTSVVGILYSICMLMSTSLQKTHKALFTQTTLNYLNDNQLVWFLLGVISLKLILLVYYPRNTSIHALSWSLFLTTMYIVSYIVW